MQRCIKDKWSKDPLMGKLEREAESIQDLLMKVSKSNWCLICGLKLSNETLVRAHILNIHQEGSFPCHMQGCDFVGITNGDLRMHCLIYHAREMTSLVALPNNPLAPTIIPAFATGLHRQILAHQQIIHRQIVHQPIENMQVEAHNSIAQSPIKPRNVIRPWDANQIDLLQTKRQNATRTINQRQIVQQKATHPPVQKINKRNTSQNVVPQHQENSEPPEDRRRGPRKKKPEEDLEPELEPPERAPDNNTSCYCGMIWYTVLGLEMHKIYHDLTEEVPKMKKMCDIESVDELKRQLEMDETNNKGDEASSYFIPVPIQQQYAGKMITFSLPVQITIPAIRSADPQPGTSKDTGNAAILPCNVVQNQCSTIQSQTPFTSYQSQNGTKHSPSPAGSVVADATPSSGSFKNFLSENIIVDIEF